MAATFPCPYCGASYPVKPVLVGRPVRCTTCRNVFQLREDGVADRVDPPEAAPERSPYAPPEPTTDPVSTTPTPPPPPPPPPPEPTTQPATDSITASPATADEERADRDRRDTGSTRRKHSSRLTVKQEEMRRNMAASLKDAAERALATEQVRRDEEQASREQKKAALKEGGVGQIKPAVLTGEGEVEARTNRAWAIGCFSLLLLVLVAWLATGGTSPEQAALASFVEPAPESDDWGRNREEVIRRRAWLYTEGTPYIINMDDAELEAPVTIDLSRQSGGLAELLGGQVLLQQGRARFWIAATQVEAAQAVFVKSGTDADAVALGKALAKAEISCLLHDEAMQKMSEIIGDPQAAGVLRLLLEGRTSADGANWIRTRFCLGDPLRGDGQALVPQHIELLPFHGTGGKRAQRPLDSTSRQYQIHDQQQYRGRLLRFADPNWASAADGKPMAQWRVLDVQVANREGRFPQTLGYPEQAPADPVEATE